MHNLIAVIAATLQPDAATKMGVATRDAGLFRDMLCAKVVSHGQARATAVETNLDIVGAPIQSKVRLAGKIGNQDMSAAKSSDPNPRDKGNPVNPVPTSTLAPPQLTIASAMPIHAAWGDGRQEVPAAALSDIVGAVSAKSSSNAPTTSTANPALNLTIKNPEGSSKPDLKVVNPSPSQSRLQPHYQFQAPSEATLEESISSTPSGQIAPLSSTQISAPEPSLISSPGAAGAADGRFLLDALADRANTWQKTVESDPSPVSTPTVAAIPEDRNTASWQDQPANNADVSSESTSAGVTAATAVPTPAASPTMITASLFGETNLANIRQKTVESDQSLVSTRTVASIPEGRSTSSLQDQPANSNEVNPGNATTDATAATTVPAPATLPVVIAGNLFVETNPAGAIPVPQSLNSLRKANSAEPGHSDRKEDRNLVRSLPMATDAQAEPQSVPLQAEGPELTVRAGDTSQATAMIGRNPNPDRTAAATAPGGLDQAALQTLHAPPEGQRCGDAKAQAPFPFPASAAADTTQTAPPVMQSARVLDRMGQSEIRVGLNTADFGNLELHTRVNQDRVAATLATSHNELRAALVAEMPSLQQAMMQHRLTLDSFHLDTHSGAQPNKNHGAPADSQKQSQAWEQTAVGPGTAAEGLPVAETVPSPIWIHPYSSGLNVHA